MRLFNYTVYDKKLHLLLYHHIFTLTMRNCMKIPKTTKEMLPIVNVEYVFIISYFLRNLYDH